jgi:hypothetical protein
VKVSVGGDAKPSAGFHNGEEDCRLPSGLGCTDKKPVLLYPSSRQILAFLTKAVDVLEVTPTLK